MNSGKTVDCRLICFHVFQTGAKNPSFGLLVFEPDKHCVNLGKLRLFPGINRTAQHLIGECVSPAKAQRFPDGFFKKVLSGAGLQFQLSESNQ